ncbi:F0F1 ATP synthase subunit I [Citrobacter sp. JGM124]|uniref:F0F1 ATP synthase subunit I n=1 Tax=Citrobacter sp. JGM124 TaxID=2799789 RepID=UPI001BA9F302|nr:F0F1 ATP synthase subunit I [Citrobacter sp. JGM124]MBS0848021.1 F0F1 ATP synthase subunit I [Citrobacter sp. JGM124]
MSVSFYIGSVARKLLLLQFLVMLAIGLLFCLKGPVWALSALGGGMAVWLPNVLFAFFAWRHQAHTPGKGRISWSFAFGEIAKMIATFAILVVALAYFKAVFLPLIVTWVSVLVVQILAPAVINNKG